MGLLKRPIFFVLLTRFENSARHLQAGEYAITPNTTPKQLLRKMKLGDVIHYKMTLIEGWTFKEIMNALSSNPHITHDLTGLSAQAIAAKLKLQQKNPEGLFFPDTYNFTAGSSDFAILERAHAKLVELLQSDWKERAKGLPYKNSYQALIVASMIEKETSLDAEKPEIAGVIVRRLQKWMHLQIDATVIYGLGNDYQGKLTRKDLQFKSPYNTYLHYGLPPTPISIPGAESIWAALHPKPGKVMYYVAKPDGSHQFSVTLAEHDAAIRKYLQKKPNKGELRTTN